MLKQTIRQKGFTIIELLIVIVIIGILATLVLSTYASGPAKARDSKRLTDINSIATQLEIYNSETGGYPTFTGKLDTDSWVQQNLKGLDINALRPPNQTANSMVNSATPTKDQYGYQAFQSDGVTACTAEPCAKFKLYWAKETANNAVQVKTSLQ